MAELCSGTMGGGVERCHGVPGRYVGREGRAEPEHRALRRWRLNSLAPQLPFVDAFLALPLNRRLATSCTLVISLFITMLAIGANDEVHSHSGRFIPCLVLSSHRCDGTRPTRVERDVAAHGTRPSRLPAPCHGPGVSHSFGRVLCAYHEEHGRVTRLGEVVSLTREEQAKPPAAERRHGPRGA